MTGSQAILPNLIIGGVNKAGTSALFAYLNGHPDVCGSSVKEVNFFRGRHSGRGGGGLDNYASHFRHCPPQKRVIFEASPNYLQRGGAVARQISRALPGVRLVFILREPASRLYSFYNFRTAGQKMNSNLTFDEYVDKCFAYSVNHESPESLGLRTRQLRGMETGRYATYLREFYEVFPKENIKVLFLENLRTDPATLMKELCAFLDIDGSYYDSIQFRRVNETYRPKMRGLHKTALRLNRRLEAFFHRHQRLKARLVHAYKLLNKAGIKADPISPTAQQRLDEYYREANAELAALLSDYEHLPEWVQNERSR